MDNNKTRAEYILDHYSRSKNDKTVLSRHLDEHDAAVRFDLQIHINKAIKQGREQGQIEGLQQAINTIAVHGMGHDTVIELHRIIKEIQKP